MRELTLAKSGMQKVRAHQNELKASDLEDSLRSLPPGEWVLLKGSGVEVWVAYVNPLVDEKFASVQIVHQSPLSSLQTFGPEAFIEGLLRRAHQRRQFFLGYGNHARLFYGSRDGLPGLLVDAFGNTAIIQINTAGVDRYRELIRQIVSELIHGKAYFLDNAKYREKELLPTYTSEPVPELVIQENGLEYHLRPEVLQKVGFYYDHRENRHQLTQLLPRLRRNFSSAVDLFSYLGAWGMSALKAGVSSCDFVDQGDFQLELQEGLRRNGFEGRGHFHRGDVFKFLDEKIQSGQNYDLLLCDPPAFAKSSLQKSQALEGYSKLHRKVLRLAGPSSLVAFSSCTQYVSPEEFQKNVLDAAYKENRRVQMIYSGLQGWDHPIPSLFDRSSYIKSYFYIVE